MQVWKYTVWIERSPERVFDFLFDFDQAPRWRSFVRSMEQVDPGPAQAGTRIRSLLDVAGEEQELVLTLTALERPRVWRHRTGETDFVGEVEYKLVPENNGTRVTLRAQATPVTLYGWLALPLLFLNRGRAYREQLPRLKQALEEGSSRE